MHKKHHFLMSQFRGLSRHMWNLKNAIFWKPLGVTISSFPDCLVFMIPSTRESLSKIWEVWVAFSIFSQWYDMELHVLWHFKSFIYDAQKKVENLELPSPYLKPARFRTTPPPWTSLVGIWYPLLEMMFWDFPHKP